MYEIRFVPAPTRAIPHERPRERTLTDQSRLVRGTLQLRITNTRKPHLMFHIGRQWLPHVTGGGRRVEFNYDCKTHARLVVEESLVPEDQDCLCFGCFSVFPN